MTLVEMGHLGRELYAAAFQIVTGQVMRVQSPPAGRLDPDIFRDTVEAHGLAPSDYAFARFADALAAQYVAHRAHLAQRGRALLGAADTLAELAMNPAVVQTVVTGNVKTVAIIKLDVFGMAPFIDFDVGGYGSEGRARAELVALARHRAATKYAATFDPRDTVLVGDSRHDIVAGRDSGVVVIGVATGRDSADELRDAGATRVLSDLSDTPAVLVAILGNGGAAVA